VTSNAPTAALAPVARQSSLKEHGVYAVETIETTADLAGLAAEWPAFVARCDNPDFHQDPEKLRLQWQFEHRDRQLRLFVLRRDGQIDCVAPFNLSNAQFTLKLGLIKLLRLPVRQYRLAGTGLGFARDADKNACLDALAQALRARRGEFDLATIESLDVEDPLFSHGLTGFRVLPAAPQPEVVRALELAEDFEAYLGRFKKKPRYNLKRNVRLLEEFCEGDLQVQRIDQPEQVADFFDALDHIFARCWQGKTLGYRARNSESEVGYHRALAEQGWLRCYLLRGKGQPVAYVLGYQYAGRYYYEEIGYDQDWREQNPGNALTFLMLEDLHGENRPDLLDFGYGENTYKQVFGSRFHMAVNSHIVPRAGKGRMLVGAQRTLGRVYNGVRGLVLKSGLEKKVRALLRRG
jgi:CelD/BcsL family acetyltransferase involved in cellulose biosynthesis